MCFDWLKEALCKTLVLRLLNFRKPFVFDFDAPEKAVRAVLLQIYKDVLHPMACISKI